MNILLLNLTRFGDLLQTQAAITDIVRQGHTVGIVCLENFAEAAGLLRGVAHVSPLRGGALLACLGTPPSARNGDRGGWRQALADLALWRDALDRAFAPDIVCNLTPSLPARLLTLFLSREKRASGFIVDEQGFGLNTNSWAAFLQGASLARGVSPFNVVDMFRKIVLRALAEAGTDPGRLEPGEAGLLPPDTTECAVMRERLRDLAPLEGKGFVAFQLGASEDRRRWPVASFVALGERLWARAKLCPVLIGSRSETGLAKRYAEAAGHPHIDLCGATGLKELAAALCSVSLLVTNDTGTMHLAAGLKLPLAAVFLATAQPFDTGPYLEGSCALEPDMDCHPCAFGAACAHDGACRKAVTPEFMEELVLGYLGEGRWRSPADTGWAGRTARVWESFFDAQGCMALRSLSGHEHSARSVWLTLQRHYIRLFLERNRETAFAPLPLARSVVLPRRMREEIIATASGTGNLIALMTQQGRVLAARGTALMRKRFLTTWQKVYESLRQNPHFAVLAVLWAQETQMEGQDLPCVLAVAEQFSRLLAEISSNLGE